MFWVQGDWLKRSAAKWPQNDRVSRRFRNRRDSAGFCGRLLYPIESHSKDFLKIIQRAIEWDIVTLGLIELKVSYQRWKCGRWRRMESAELADVNCDLHRYSLKMASCAIKQRLDWSNWLPYQSSGRCQKGRPAFGRPQKSRSATTKGAGNAFPSSGPTPLASFNCTAIDWVKQSISNQPGHFQF